jgi:hypothetical protein
VHELDFNKGLSMDIQTIAAFLKGTPGAAFADAVSAAEGDAMLAGEEIEIPKPKKKASKGLLANMNFNEANFSAMLGQSSFLLSRAAPGDNRPLAEVAAVMALNVIHGVTPKNEDLKKKLEENLFHMHGFARRYWANPDAIGPFGRKLLWDLVEREGDPALRLSAYSALVKTYHQGKFGGSAANFEKLVKTLPQMEDLFMQNIALRPRAWGSEDKVLAFEEDHQKYGFDSDPNVAISLFFEAHQMMKVSGVQSSYSSSEALRNGVETMLKIKIEDQSQLPLSCQRISNKMT